MSFPTSVYSFAGVLLLFSSFSAGQDWRPREQQRIQTIARAIQSCVGVFGPGGQGGGSGVIISPDGFALTNYHVIESCESFMKCSLNDGKLYDAVIVGIDPTGDVAMIRLLGREDFPFAVLADSDGVASGDECFAVGNPFLLATDFQPTVSWGIVSGVHRYQYPTGTLLEYADCIQTDAAINPGNSGGPLFNADGQLIGINGRGSFEKRGRVNVGVGYAISSNQLKFFLSHLKSGRIVDHATLGATVAADADGTIRVEQLLESADAFRRGLQIGDEIVRVADRNIESVNQLKNVLGIFPKGWQIRLVYRRDQVETEILVRLTGVHAHEELVEIVQGIDPADSEKKDAPPTDPPIPGGSDSPAPVKQTDIPPEFQAMYVARRAFANYYFNQQQLERIWQGSMRHGDFRKQDFQWRITGQTEDGKAVSIVLGNEKSGLQLGTETLVLDPNQDLASQVAAPGMSSLLVGMHLWRKFLIGGPQSFDEVTYVGSVPYSTEGGLGDLLIGSTDSVEAHFIFDTSDQQLLRMETFTDRDTDNDEVIFLSPRSDGDLSLPSELQFGRRGQAKKIIRIDRIEFVEK